MNGGENEAGNLDGFNYREYWTPKLAEFNIHNDNKES